MSKPIREFWVVESKNINGQPNRIYNMKPNWLPSDIYIHVIDYESYQRLLDANKKLMAALELICDSTHGKDCDLIADKVAKLALSEASKIEGGK